MLASGMAKRKLSLTGLALSVLIGLWSVGVEMVRAEENGVSTGAQVLADKGFRKLAGKRVGLIVNPVSSIGDDHLIDILHDIPDIELVAVFGPEHGLRGTGFAGEEVVDARDQRTGVPVYSLYGKTRKPTAEMLSGIDVLVFDLQDVGARFYTYISTMGLAMQAAAETGTTFLVLDRPNPLGGDYVAGFDLDDKHRTFVGQYDIPIVHGLTVGELALMIKGEKLLDGLEKLDLEVVELTGWRRVMRWRETGLPWINPSPAIVDPETALVYAGTCFFEAASLSYGRGTDRPFRLIGAPWADGAALAETLNARRLPGVRFEAARFTPRFDGAKAFAPAYADETVSGIRIHVTADRDFRPLETGIHVLHAILDHAREQGQGDVVDRPEWLAKLSGTDALLRMLKGGEEPVSVIAAWQSDVAAFKKRRKPYLLYD